MLNSDRTKEGVGSKRWKRLQLMAETKVKNNPEKYSQIAMHKFPLRDWSSTRIEADPKNLYSIRKRKNPGQGQ